MEMYHFRTSPETGAGGSKRTTLHPVRRGWFGKHHCVVCAQIGKSMGAQELNYAKTPQIVDYYGLWGFIP